MKVKKLIEKYIMSGKRNLFVIIESKNRKVFVVVFRGEYGGPRYVGGVIYKKEGEGIKRLTREGGKMVEIKSVFSEVNKIVVDYRWLLVDEKLEDSRKINDAISLVLGVKIDSAKYKTEG